MPLRLPKQAGPSAGGHASPHRASNTGRTSPHPAGSVSPTRRRQSLDVKRGDALKIEKGARRSLDVSDSGYARKAAAVVGRSSPTLEPLPPAAGQPGGGAKGTAATQGEAGAATPFVAAATGAAAESKDAAGAKSGAARFGRRLLNLFGGGKGTGSTATATHAAPQQQQKPRPPQPHVSEGYAVASEQDGAAVANTDAAQLLCTRSGSGHTQWTAGRDGTAAATDMSGSQLAHTLTTDTSLSTSQHFDKLYSSELSGCSPTPGSASVAAATAVAGHADHRPLASAASPDAATDAAANPSRGARRPESMAAGTNQRKANAPLLAPGKGLSASATAPTACGLPRSGSFTPTASVSFGPAMLTAATGAAGDAWPVQESPSLAEVLASASAEAQLPLRGGGRGGRQRRSSLDFTPALPAHLRASLDSSGLPSLTALGAAQEVARMRSSLATVSAAAGGAQNPGGAGRLRPSLELFGGTAPSAMTRGETRGSGGGGGQSRTLNPCLAAPMQPALQRAPGLQSGMPAQGGPGGGWGGGSCSTGQLLLVGTDMDAPAGAEALRVAAGGGASRELHLAAGGVGARYGGGGGGGIAGGAGRYQASAQPAAATTWAAAEAAAASSVSAPLPTLHGGLWGASATVSTMPMAAVAAAAGVQHPTGAPAAAGPPVGGWRVARAPVSSGDAPLPRIGTAGAPAMQQQQQQQQQLHHHHQHHHHHHHGFHLNLTGSELPALRGGHMAAATSAPGEAPPSPHCAATAAAGATAAGAAAAGDLVRRSREFGLAARKATAPIRSGPGGSGSLVVTGNSSVGCGSGGHNTMTLHPTADALLATMQTLHSPLLCQPNLAACSSSTHNLPQSPGRFASCPATHGAITTAAAVASTAGGGSSTRNPITTGTGGTASATPAAASAPKPGAEAAVTAATEAAVAVSACTLAWATGSVSSGPSGGGGGGGGMPTERGGRGPLDSEVGEPSPARWAPHVPAPATLHPLQPEPITGIAGRAALAPSAPGFGLAAVRRDVLAGQNGRGSRCGERGGGDGFVGGRGALADTGASDDS
ncbi:hypothetical protein HYH02_009971 [Chlamydomonas schloesseri]|uniref:Uncharacterized protein n=1 Tax=Chlamydomonas schloesseri TaxID=2026947 RepID=A0A835TMC2_9CHLO|nr:hypothetical protein HYH02_009971 [Chlamydomonas schloesseri]|eukprot:KAG2441381.1 hypothetical protein HYH02_009971 [Chlamydomonas schloesseri]